jgi:hypothetical protein
VYQCIFHFAVIDEEATNIIFSSAFAIVAVNAIADIADTAVTLGLLLHFTWIFLGLSEIVWDFVVK